MQKTRALLRRIWKAVPRFTAFAPLLDRWAERGSALVETHCRKGALLQNSCSYQSAREEFGNAIMLDPKCADARLGRAACVCHMFDKQQKDKTILWMGSEEDRRDAAGDLQSAIATFLERYETDKENPEIHAKLGKAHYYLAVLERDDEKACEYLNEARVRMIIAAKLLPGHQRSEPYTLLAEILFRWVIHEINLANKARENGDYVGAAGHLKKAGEHYLAGALSREEARSVELALAKLN